MGVPSEASRAGRSPAFPGFVKAGHATEMEDIGVIKNKVSLAHFERHRTQYACTFWRAVMKKEGWLVHFGEP